MLGPWRRIGSSVWTVAGLLAFVGCVTGGGATSTPDETVRRFCQMDLEGVRLTSATDDRVNPLVAWEQEPAPDPVHVVRGFDVGPAQVSGDTAEVGVTYDVVGVVGAPWKGAPSAAESSVTYQLIRRGGSWRIVGPPVTPHASPEALARVIRTWPQTGSGGNDERLQDTLRYLDSLAR